MIARVHAHPSDRLAVVPAPVGFFAKDNGLYYDGAYLNRDFRHRPSDKTGVYRAIYFRSSLMREDDWACTAFFLEDDTTPCAVAWADGWFQVASTSSARQDPNALSNAVAIARRAAGNVPWITVTTGRAGLWALAFPKDEVPRSRDGRPLGLHIPMHNDGILFRSEHLTDPDMLKPID